MKSLQYYQELGYGEINNFLRKTTDFLEIAKQNPNDKLVKTILEIDSVMKNTGEYNDVIIYRGYSGGFIPMALETTSGVIVDTAYGSSTTSLDIAKKFISNDGCCIIAFKIPNNIKYHKFVKDYEKEILIERNTQFIINLDYSTPPIYYATLSKWSPTSIPCPNPLMKELINSMKQVLTEKCKEIGEEAFLEERKQKYIIDGENEEDSTDLAESDVLEYC